MRKVALLAFFLSLSASAHALDLAGRELFIPAAGRVPGASGTFWQTDLVITNLSPEYDLLRVRVDFYAGGTLESFDVDVMSGESAVIEDFVRTKLGRDNAFGTIHLTAAQSDAQLKAEAIIHNVGGEEPLGQTVNALPVASLQTRSLIGGLQTTGGHRSNVGVGNPHDEPVTVLISPPHGLSPRTITLAPHTNAQMDALTTESSTVLFTASKPVYAYGSVIRDGGDPQFVLPVEVRPTSSFVVAPACSNAVPLALAPAAPAPGWIVQFKAGVESDTETPRLVARHGFTPSAVYSAAIEGFAAELTPQQLAALRCEPTILLIEQNQWASVR
ncbi:MAG TPA: protease inhibitor I9 family protein [Thermoanaerobaculia bacterium]|nr:protease inhibitor I9 family protein [Thermoanaerobaculia bacterium]